MSSFAFIIHPIAPKRDVARKYPFLGTILPEGVVHFLSRFWPPVYLSRVVGGRSEATGQEIEGWLIAVPYTAQRMLALPTHEVYRKIVAAGELAERLGAKVLGLGAYTSVIGDGGLTIARELDIPVTSGDSYTAAIAVRATRQAASMMNIELSKTTLAIVGATGAIGGAVAQKLGPEAGQVLLVGRRAERLTQVAERVQAQGAHDVALTQNIADLREAEVVITVTSAGGGLVKPEYLRSGAVVCDVSRPRDVSWQVAQMRNDVLVFDGGLVTVPGTVDFGFDYGLPPGLTFGCMAETMTLAFEKRFEDYSLGKDLTLEQMDEIDGLASKHGFRLAALRSFERKLDEAVIARVKACASRGGPLPGNDNVPSVDDITSQVRVGGQEVGK
ncbi:MAG: shikimate dehydrogenase [Anaerolineae bacterium]|nr:shikimate dehydrogenase [Anaerolineae bacterium]